jgi:hypothetical protein
MFEGLASGTLGGNLGGTCALFVYEHGVFGVC